MSREDRDPGTGTTQYCTFHVDHLLIGIEVWRVQEVVRLQQMTPVPLGPPEVEGLINLRGQIVTAIDVRRWLGLPPRGAGERAMNAVVRLGDEAVSLLVDHPGEVVSPPPGAFEPVPPTVSEQIRSRFVGTFTLADALLLVLDPTELATIAGAPRDHLRRSA